MTPRPGEPGALKQIEEQLAASDPVLSTMLSVFNADPARAGECSRTVPPRRARAKHAAVLIVLAMCLFACVSMAALSAA